MKKELYPFKINDLFLRKGTTYFLRTPKKFRLKNFLLWKITKIVKENTESRFIDFFDYLRPIGDFWSY